MLAAIWNKCATPETISQ